MLTWYDDYEYEEDEDGDGDGEDEYYKEDDYEGELFFIGNGSIVIVDPSGLGRMAMRHHLGLV